MRTLALLLLFPAISNAIPPGLHSPPVDGADISPATMTATQMYWGAAATRSTGTTTGGLDLATNADVTITGATGLLTAGSSVTLNGTLFAASAVIGSGATLSTFSAAGALTTDTNAAISVGAGSIVATPGGANANIKIGNTAAYQGNLQYASGGNTFLYLDNSYDNAAGATQLRTRTAGTPVVNLTLLGSAYVGVNETAPAGNLEVTSNQADTGFVLAVTSQSAVAGNLLSVLGNGNVGVGTTAPGTLLNISSGTLTVDGTSPRAIVGTQLENVNIVGSGNPSVTIDKDVDADYASLRFFNSGNVKFSLQQRADTSLEFVYGDFQTPDVTKIPLSIRAMNVGVGTLTPSSKLHLSSGTLTIDGNTAASITTTGSVTISSGTALRNLLMGATVGDCPSVTLATSGVCSVAATGVNASDICTVQADALEANLTISISSASLNVVAFRLNNPTVGNIDPASQTYRWACLRP